MHVQSQRVGLRCGIVSAKQLLELNHLGFIFKAICEKWLVKFSYIMYVTFHKVIFGKTWYIDMFLEVIKILALCVRESK